MSSVPKKQRNSSIEILRILAILGVVVLYYNNSSIGGAFNYIDNAPISKAFLYFIESICIVGVNVFVLITGYYLSTKDERIIIKPFKLLIQTVIFKVGAYVVQTLITNDSLTIKNILLAAIPNSWFIILYIALYLISPILNIVIKSVNDKALTRIVLILVLVFSIYPTITDLIGEALKNPISGISTIGSYGSQWGYTIVNFVTLYFIGAYLRRCPLRLSTVKHLLFLILSTGIIEMWAYINDVVGFEIERTAWSYCNPFVVLSSILLVSMFSRFNLGTNQIINSLSSSTFSIYLLNCYLFPLFNIPYYASKGLGVMIINLVFTVVGIFSICYAVTIIYNAIMKFVYAITIDKLQVLQKDIYKDSNE